MAGLNGSTKKLGREPFHIVDLGFGVENSSRSLTDGVCLGGFAKRVSHLAKGQYVSHGITETKEKGYIPPGKAQSGGKFCPT